MPQWLEFSLLLIAAYLVGSIPVAYLVVKAYRGVDLRNYGSGVVGGSNVFRNFSKPLGIAVGVFDTGKGALIVWIAHLLGMGTAMEIAVGIAIIVGHNWPVFLHFNAGRGLATTVGVAIYLLPPGLIVFAFCAAFTLVVGGAPLPTLVGVGVLPVTAWVLHLTGWWHIDDPLILILGLTALFLILVIRRLTAPKTASTKLVSTHELLINRLLFDRDIRDGKSWITRRPKEAGELKK